jgi:phosphatidylglycerophosphate synthase
MLDHRLRTYKDHLLIAIAQRLGHVHPTTITVIGFGIGVIAALLLVQQQYGLALFFWLLNRSMDGLDGLVARLHQRQSDLGGYLDIMLDFAIYALIPICLVIGAPSLHRYLALAFLLSSFYLNAASWMYLSAIQEKNATGARARGERTSVTMPDGLIGGSETIIFFTLFLLCPDYVIPLFGAMGLLVFVTIGQRVAWAVRHLD